MAKNKETLYLIDGSSCIHRAFHAIKNLRTSRGLPTNAVYGFTGMLNRVLREEKPRYLAIALDSPGPTFRHELSPSYKANREQMPEALSVQIPFIKRLIAAYGISYVEMPGYEADDIIGTLTHWAASEAAQVVIVSGDKDLLQLVKPGVRLWDTMKDVVMEFEEVEQRHGVSSSQLVEVMGLAGDSVDNIPGVPGIGPKTAQRLIREFGTIENLLANLEKIPRESERKKLETYAEQARLSRQLAIINCQVPLEKDWSELEVGGKDEARLIDLLKQLEFKKFLQELRGNGKNAAPAPVWRQYPAVSSRARLDEILMHVRACQNLGFAVQTAGKDPLRAELLGLALAWAPGAACYIPLGPVCPESVQQLDGDAVLEALEPVLTDPAVSKTGHNSKSAWIALKKQGIDLAGIRFDTMVGAYLLEPGRSGYNLSDIFKEHLDESVVFWQELMEAAGKEGDLVDIPVDQACNSAAAEAEACLRLATVMGGKLGDADQASLFHEVEMPLVPVLARMQLTGVRVDVDRLEHLAKNFNQRLEISAEKIYALAGERFNINSPCQLGRILFDKLGLPMRRRTKTGYSTAVEVLAELALYHPLPSEVLKYRSIRKLKGTYVDVLPRLVSAETGRIHTSYNQTVTVTGRLSCSEPNLQNIPVRSEEGREIRRAFVAEPGCKLLAADYSQIELRILAHYSGDEALLEAFQRGEDIHRRTAAEIFQVDPEKVTGEMRRQAKTINFGIVYGMSPFRLARELGIAQGAAREMLENYFKRYQGVRSYMEEMPRVGREQGFVSTLFKRKRFLPDLHSRNRSVRQFAERTAINTPIQGSAADIIKIAMIRIDARMEQEGLPGRMIMQVHDELVFEVEAGAVEEVAALVRREMESVASLDVALVVEMGWGVNWDEAH
ncbi:MAG: DNA polymerase I [Syntrophobacteria bacterium]